MMAVYNGDGPAYPPTARIRFDAIGEAFNLVKDQAGTWILTTLVWIIVAVGVGFLEQLVTNAILPNGARSNSSFQIGVFLATFFSSQIISIVVSAFFTGGFYRMALKQIRGENIGVGDLFSASDVIGPLIGGMLLMILAIDAGMVLCIVPGLLAAGLLMFVPALIVDRKVGAVEALRMSWNALRGDMLNAFAFIFVAGLLSTLGIFLCGVGILFTVPLCYVAIAVVYQDFFGARGLNQEPTIDMPLPPQPGGDR